MPHDIARVLQAAATGVWLIDPQKAAEMRKELAELKAHTKRADFEKIRTSKDQLLLAEKADTRGIKLAE
jgi:hypothetical protein